MNRCGFDRLRHNHNAVLIGEDEIARMKANSVDFNRDININHALTILAVVETAASSIDRKLERGHLRLHGRRDERVTRQHCRPVAGLIGRKALVVVEGLVPGGLDE